MKTCLMKKQALNISLIKQDINKHSAKKKIVCWQLPPTTVHNDHMEPQGHKSVEGVPGLMSDVIRSFKNSALRHESPTYANAEDSEVTWSNVSLHIGRAIFEFSQL